jgi:hypothetical protein
MLKASRLLSYLRQPGRSRLTRRLASADLCGRTLRSTYRLRINAYRVLLTRGRDGMIIFVPPIEQLRETRRVLIDAGCQELA